jgi:DNA-binding PadR family transcriptional regulator
MSRDTGNDLKAHIEEIDKLVHEPARLLLMAHLYVVEEADFVFMMDRTGLTAGNRPQTSYQLTREGRRAFDAYRDNIEEILQMLPERER